MNYFKLRDWVDKEKLCWETLSANPNAIDLLEKNKNKINWSSLSANPNAIQLFSMQYL